MSLELTLDVVEPALGTLESLRVRVHLRNRGSVALDLPGTSDTTDALDVRAYDSPAPTAVADWHANYRLRHLMMISDRPDWTEPSIESLAPGDIWTWELDLASMQYPLAIGDHWIEAFYRHTPLGIELRSPRVAISVRESRVLAVAVTRDDCVLDGLHVLLKADGADGIEWVGRLHNAGRPLAAWWSGKLDAGATGTHVLAAYNAFHRDDTFDHFFDRWIIDVSSSEARSHRIDATLAVKERRTTRLPGSPGVPRAAYWDGADGIYLLSSVQGGSLRCQRLVSGEAEHVFVHGSSFHLGTPSEVVVDRELIHVVIAGRQLAYERLDHSGNVVLRRELPRSRLEPFSCRYDVDRGRVLAIFRDGPNGRLLRLVVLDVRTGEVAELERSVQLKGRTLTEVDFDVDLSGRFHILVTTSDGRLYYLRNDAGPLLLATGEERFLPFVHTPRRVYLGYYETRFGWRFRQYTPHLPGLRPLPHQRRPDGPSGGEPEDPHLGATSMELPADAAFHITGTDLGQTAEDLPQWDDDTARNSIRIVDSADPDREPD